MRDFLWRFLRLAKTFRIIKKIYVVKYRGKAFSLNDFYQGGNSSQAWRKRKKIKDTYGEIFQGLIKEAGIPRIDKFFLVVFYNSLHDVDNISGMSKVFVDCMKDIQIENDTKNYYKGMVIVHDPLLKKNSFDFMIITTTNGD